MANRRWRAGRGRSGALAVVAALALVASCTKSVSTTTNSTVSTSTVASTGTTTAPSTTPSTAVTLTEADLEALLPTVADVGSGYRIAVDDDSGDDEESEMDDAMEQACPAFAALADSDADDAPDAERSFEAVADDGRSIDVNLSGDLSTSTVPDRASMQQAIDAINACDTIETTSEGIHFTGTLSIRADDSHGDFGAVLEMKWVGEHEQLPGPIRLDAVMYLVAVGDVGMTVAAFGGTEPDTFASIPPDADVAEKLVGRLEVALHDAQ